MRQIKRWTAQWVVVVCCTALSWAATATAVSSFAAEPPTLSMLRIDPGEHTAKIGRIATNRAGRWLVTASDYKTACHLQVPLFRG